MLCRPDLMLCWQHMKRTLSVYVSYPVLVKIEIDVADETELVDIQDGNLKLIKGLEKKILDEADQIVLATATGIDPVIEKDTINIL